MRCPKCGKELQKGTVICPVCGQKVTERKKSRPGRWLALSGVLLAGAAALLLGYHFGKEPKQNQELVTFLNQGSHYLAMQDYEQAEIVYSQALELDETSEEAMLGLAQAFTGQNETDLAQDILLLVHENLSDPLLAAQHTPEDMDMLWGIYEDAYDGIISHPGVTTIHVPSPAITPQAASETTTANREEPEAGSGNREGIENADSAVVGGIESSLPSREEETKESTAATTEPYMVTTTEPDTMTTTEPDTIMIKEPDTTTTTERAEQERVEEGVSNLISEIEDWDQWLENLEEDDVIQDTVSEIAETLEEGLIWENQEDEAVENPSKLPGAEGEGETYQGPEPEPEPEAERERKPWEASVYLPLAKAAAFSGIGEQGVGTDLNYSDEKFWNVMWFYGVANSSFGHGGSWDYTAQEFQDVAYALLDGYSGQIPPLSAGNHGPISDNGGSYTVTPVSTSLDLTLLSYLENGDGSLDATYQLLDDAYGWQGEYHFHFVSNENVNTTAAIPYDYRISSLTFVPY